MRHRFRCIWSLLTEEGIVRARDNLLTARRTLLELWISPPLTRLRERVEDGRDDGGHDPEQHE